jgi:hypothetical protein
MIGALGLSKVGRRTVILIDFQLKKKKKSRRCSTVIDVRSFGGCDIDRSLVFLKVRGKTLEHKNRQGRYSRRRHLMPEKN